MDYRLTKVILLFSFLFFSFGLLGLYNQMSFVIIPIVSCFIYLPMVFKIFFFHNLNFDFKGMKTCFRLNVILNILSELFLLVISSWLAYSAILTYDLKNKENVANMIPYFVLGFAVILYFIASSIVNKWRVLIGPVLGGGLVLGYYLVMRFIGLT